MFGAHSAIGSNKFSRSFWVQHVLQQKQPYSPTFKTFGAGSATNFNSNFKPTDIKIPGAGPINLLGQSIKTYYLNLTSVKLIEPLPGFDNCSIG